MIPQNLPPGDLFALSRAFCGLSTADLSKAKKNNIDN